MLIIIKNTFCTVQCYFEIYFCINFVTHIIDVLQNKKKISNENKINWVLPSRKRKIIDEIISTSIVPEGAATIKRIFGSNSGGKSYAKLHILLYHLPIVTLVLTENRY